MLGYLSLEGKCNSLTVEDLGSRVRQLHRTVDLLHINLYQCWHPFLLALECLFALLQKHIRLDCQTCQPFPWALSDTSAPASHLTVLYQQAVS